MLVLVHMGTDEQGAELFARYGLDDVRRVSDRRRRLYAAFGLIDGGLGQILGPTVIRRGIEAHRAGATRGVPIGSVRQMPGDFLVYRGEIVKSFRHERISDRPDYVALADCGAPCAS